MSTGQSYTAHHAAHAQAHRPLDTAHCPLCGQANQCAMAQDPPPARCWCMDSVIPDSALAAIPEAERSQRCICPACAHGKPV